MALRDSLSKSVEEGNLTKAELSIANAMITSLNELISLGKAKDAAYQSLIAVYENIVKIQGDMIEKLEKRLLKPKSLFDKVIGILKNVGYILAGVSLGRVL